MQSVKRTVGEIAVLPFSRPFHGLTLLLIMWLFLWPLPLLRLLGRITDLRVTVGRVMLFALLGDYLLLSFLAYLCFILGRFLKRKVSGSPVPPPPLPFTK